MTQAMHLVLVVEDDPLIRKALKALLESAHFRCAQAETAGRAEIEARAHKPDLLLVDLGLPDRDGLVVIRRIREWSSVPIIVLSARQLEEQKIEALDAGADDYVSKPFSAAELLARVRAALRRNVRSAETPHEIALGEAHIDLARRTARGSDGDIHLTPLEYRVLECLARRAGFIVTQHQLVREVWGPLHVGDTQSLRACMKNLRAKLEPDPRRPAHLVTEPGVGYRLRVDQRLDGR